MTKLYGSQSMVNPLQTVLVRRPGAAFGNADPTEWHYVSQPELAEAQAEHDALSAQLRDAGIELVYHETPLPDCADAIFVHDPVLICDAGAILLNMGKPLRQPEPAAIGLTLEQMGIPIYAKLEGEALAEGGDLLWLDEKTLAVGLGFRTNHAGMKRLEAALNPLGVTVIPVHLPFYQGEEACLHLMSFISMIDHDLAVIYEPLMPVPFWQELQRRGVQFVSVPDEEWVTMGANVLAIAPRHCLMLRDNPITKRRLEAAGCQTLTYKGDEISLKAEGGATCLTRPVLRV